MEETLFNRIERAYKDIPERGKGNRVIVTREKSRKPRESGAQIGDEG